MPYKNPEKRKTFARDYYRMRYQTDPEYRAKVLKRNKDWYAMLPKSSRRLSSFYKIKIKPGTVCLYCNNISRHLALCKVHYHRWYNGHPMETYYPQNRTLNREELAWAAGLFDGEGSTCRTKHQGANGKLLVYPRMSMGQIVKGNLERFHKAVGGVGKVTGPVKTPTKPRYDWRCHGFEDTQAVLALLWLWLSPTKREQAKGVLRDYKGTL